MSTVSDQQRDRLIDRQRPLWPDGLQRRQVHAAGWVVGQVSPLHRGAKDSAQDVVNSGYEPGMRSGAWMKMRVNRGREFVIGGYTLADRR